MKDPLLFVLTAILLASIALAGCGCSSVRCTSNVRSWPDGTVWTDQTFYRRSGITDFRVRQVRLEMPSGILQRVWIDGVLVMESTGAEAAFTGIVKGAEFIIK
jgi:hypothetical protein